MANSKIQNLYRCVHGPVHPICAIVTEQASVTVTRHNNDGLVDQSVNLNVVIAGNPNPVVTLQKGNGQSFEDLPASKFTVLSNGTLVINTLVAEDEGNYNVCVTDDCDGTMQCGSFSLTVIGK